MFVCKKTHGKCVMFVKSYAILMFQSFILDFVEVKGGELSSAQPFKYKIAKITCLTRHLGKYSTRETQYLLATYRTLEHIEENPLGSTVCYKVTLYLGTKGT